MKTPKLLKELNEFIDSDKKKQKDMTDSIKEILKKLKKKQHHLKRKLAEESNDKKKKQIQKDLDVIFVQRKKGLKARKKLQK